MGPLGIHLLAVIFGSDVPMNSHDITAGLKRHEDDSKGASP